MSFDLGLTGHRALVTAGTRGVGAATVAALAEAGVHVAATARRVPQEAAPGVHYIAGDITAAEGCARVAREAIARLRGIDILVNVLGGSAAPPEALQP
jgi:NAD(P)-dependent dehydrogenase (short-subunit alcohol dehydrogenase family)